MFFFMLDRNPSISFLSIKFQFNFNGNNKLLCVLVRISFKDKLDLFGILTLT